MCGLSLIPFGLFLWGDSAGIVLAVSPREAWQDKPKDSARARTQGPLGVPLHVLAIPISILFFESNRGWYKTYAVGADKTYPFGEEAGEQNVPLVWGGVGTEYMGLPRQASRPVYSRDSLLSRKKVDTPVISRYTYGVDRTFTRHTSP